MTRESGMAGPVLCYAAFAYTNKPTTKAVEAAAKQPAAVRQDTL
jgi:hypothetical protein